MSYDPCEQYKQARELEAVMERFGGVPSNWDWIKALVGAAFSTIVMSFAFLFLMLLFG